MSWLEKTIDTVVAKQRPLVVNHLREVRRKHPDMTPEQLVARLERQFLAAVSTSGAAVGATAVAPGVGTVASVGLTVAETVAFLEASAFFAQAVTEVHGIHVRDPERSKALVMSLMLGKEGSSLVKRITEQSLGRGAAGDAFWGQLITTTLPSGFVANTVVDYLKRAFLRRMTATTGRSMLGRALPFGIGAVIGGVGNHILGRHIVQAARDAFGPAPVSFDPDLQPLPKVQRPRRLRRGSMTDEMDRGLEANRRTGFGGGALDRLRRRPKDDEPPAGDQAPRDEAPGGPTA
ncbi:hypothetical protein [Agrococcus versicolor]